VYFFLKDFKLSGGQFKVEFKISFLQNENDFSRSFVLLIIVGSESLERLAVTAAFCIFTVHKNKICNSPGCCSRAGRAASA